MLQNAIPIKKSVPRPNISDEHCSMSLVLCLPRKMHLPRSSSNAPRLPSFLDMLQKPTLDNVQNPLHPPHQTTSERPKVVRDHQFLTLLTFNFDMCFAPQRRALFLHLNFQKWSEADLFCTFWLGNVLRATMACTFRHLNFQKWSEADVFLYILTWTCSFSTSQLPKVVRGWCALYILTWKCASCHNDVQFFIYLARWLRTRRFSEPTFRPSGTASHRKNTVSCDFSTFSRTCIFFLLTLSLLWSSLFFSSLLWLFPPLLFRLFILSEVSLLNFLRLNRPFSIIYLHIPKNGISLLYPHYTTMKLFPLYCFSLSPSNGAEVLRALRTLGSQRCSSW